MVQFGWNSGPRHARVFGLAKSFTKDLDDKTMVDHDTDIIAATTVVWGIAKAWLPTDITGTIDTQLAASQMPRIASLMSPKVLNCHLQPLLLKVYSRNRVYYQLE